MKKGLARLICWIIIPTLFLITAFVLSFFYYRNVSYLTLQYRHPLSNITFSKNEELIPGDTIRGEFIAKDDYLGAISLKVNTFKRINNSAIAFRLREKGQSEWYCYNTYFTDRFIDQSFYPFGFPNIKGSTGKTYEFEIFSGNGERGNTIGVMKNAGYFVSLYTYNKSTLLEKKNLLMLFAIKKIGNLFLDTSFLLNLSIFSTPLIFWILFIYYKAKVSNIPFLYIFCLLSYPMFVYMCLPQVKYFDFVILFSALCLLLSLFFL